MSLMKCDMMRRSFIEATSNSHYLLTSSLSRAWLKTNGWLQKDAIQQQNERVFVTSFPRMSIFASSPAWDLDQMWHAGSQVSGYGCWQKTKARFPKLEARLDLSRGSIWSGVLLISNKMLQRHPQIWLKQVFLARLYNLMEVLDISINLCASGRCTPSWDLIRIILLNSPMDFLKEPRRTSWWSVWSVRRSLLSKYERWRSNNVSERSGRSTKFMGWRNVSSSLFQRTS